MSIAPTENAVAPPGSIMDFDFSQLSVGQRLQLLGRLWASLEADSEQFVMSQQQWQELRRRSQEATDHPECLITLDELKARLSRS